MNEILTKTVKKFHASSIMYIKYLSNGYLASSSSDTTVNIWDPITWSSIQVYKEHTDYVYCIEQIDTDTLVSGSDTIVQIWSISTGETSFKIYNQAFSIRILSDRFRIAIGGGGSGIRLYNYQAELVENFYGNKRPVTSIEILSDEFMMSGGWTGELIIWDISTYSPKYNLIGHDITIQALKCISNNLVASGDEKGKIIIWNWLEGTLVYTLIGHTSRLFFSSIDLFDDFTLISGADKTIKFWNISNGKLIQSINTDLTQINALIVLKRGKLDAFVNFLIRNFYRRFF